MTPDDWAYGHGPDVWPSTPEAMPEPSEAALDAVMEGNAWDHSPVPRTTNPLWEPGQPLLLESGHCGQTAIIGIRPAVYPQWARYWCHACDVGWALGTDRCWVCKRLVVDSFDDDHPEWELERQHRFSRERNCTRVWA